MRRLLTPLVAAVAAALLAASPAAAAPTGNPNVNVNITTASAAASFIAEATLTGPGGGTVLFPDPGSAPGLGDVADALAFTLADLGLDAATPLGAPSLTALTPFAVVTTVVTSNLNPTDNPGLVLGDPDDYSTWIATTVDVNVEVTQTTTTWTPYRVEAAIQTQTPTPVPAPASIALLAAGLAGLAALRRRR